NDPHGRHCLSNRGVPCPSPIPDMKYWSARGRPSPQHCPLVGASSKRPHPPPPAPAPRLIAIACRRKPSSLASFNQTSRRAQSLSILDSTPDIHKTKLLSPKFRELHLY